MKNPLIPMAAITGDLTTEQIRVMLRRYTDKGISQFLMYPRDGCEVEYMSVRWLEICGDIIKTAAELGIDIWLYDEFNWPSGTCCGEVMRENPEFKAKSIIVRDGKCEIIEAYRPGKLPEHYADILNPDAVDSFIKKTHEVYYEHFGEYFGSVIKGIFTDEPGYLYFMAQDSIYPYTHGLENIWRDKFGVELFEELLAPTDEFHSRYYELLGKLFRENYIGRISAWCNAHGILLTGHLLAESTTYHSLLSSGDAIKSLRSFGLPGMDEICTRSSINSAEWLTFGVVQAAIRTACNGGLAEQFALGPTDLPPARVEQMIMLEAMFGVDHYLLAVAAADARGNVKKNGWFNPMNYMNPWFEGYGELGVMAAKAARLAKKTIAAEVCVRYPLALAIKHVADEKHKLIDRRIGELLRELTRNQYQWLLVCEDEEAPEGSVVVEITDTDDYSTAAVIEMLNERVQKQVFVLDGDKLADDLFLRKYTDGTAVVLDLRDSPEVRELILVKDGERLPLRLYGRGHYLLGEPMKQAPTQTLALPEELRLYLDRPNTLRANLNRLTHEFEFTVADRLDEVSLIVRDYRHNGEISIDGIVLPLDRSVDALTPGLRELYRATGKFTLLPGKHVIKQSIPAQSEPFLPSCFVSGYFAADDTDTLRALPKTVSCGDLRGILPQFTGCVTFEGEVDIPEYDCELAFDSSELYTRVYLNGRLIGSSLDECRFELPRELRGVKATLRVEQYTTVAPMLGRRDSVIVKGDGENWTTIENWFPHKYHRLGINRTEGK